MFLDGTPVLCNGTQRQIAMHERAEKTTLEEWGGVGKNCAKVARQRLKLI